MEGNRVIHSPNRKKIIIGIFLAAIFLFALLSIPAADPPVAAGGAGKPFAWKQDATWNALEASFRRARGIGCDGLKEPIDGGFRQGGRYLDDSVCFAVRPGRGYLCRAGK